MDGWYALEASAPHRYRVPWDDELPVAVPAGLRWTSITFAAS